MATDNVSKAATFKEFAHAHSNDLYDVVALLEAAADRIEAATPSTAVSKEGAETMHNTMRLVQMASEKAKTVAYLMSDAL